ncbi:hypothetical protein OOZ15_16485 [Galbibacter sp. EGI 63066]|uniref:hypothetical protein n=1 Tax=Galbibacter sp. EGI 63066 TaxID=2993559 RepID=UPI0022492FB9|nr:hypothetical protein [Galbibacter sp. EGI 63066]MCX2681553.1 hypothetical protein [Galbibacter sp. EGI 63066]
MKTNILILIGFLTIGCNTSKVEDLNLLNGYWEIEKMTFADGKTKEYTVNTVIDFISMKNDSVGTREKVMPRLDGTFVNMQELEDFTIRKKDGNYYMHYKNELDERSEVLIKLTKDQFVVSNGENKTYFYKRFEKFELK